MNMFTMPFNEGMLVREMHLSEQLEHGVLLIIGIAGQVVVVTDAR